MPNNLMMSCRRGVRDLHQSFDIPAPGEPFKAAAQPETTAEKVVAYDTSTGSKAISLPISAWKASIVILNRDSMCLHVVPFTFDYSATMQKRTTPQTYMNAIT